MFPDEKEELLPVREGTHHLSADLDDIIEKHLEDIVTLLCSSCGKKSKIYEELITIFEKSLFKIALRRSSYVKSAAAMYLGINRNTFQKKLVKLGIDCKRE